MPGELADTESTRQNQRDEPARASNESAQALVEDEETLTEDEQNALTAQIGILQDMLRTSIAIDKRNNKDAWADQKQATFDNMELMRKKREKIKKRAMETHEEPRYELIIDHERMQAAGEDTGSEVTEEEVLITVQEV